jgi:D-glycero-D-manno-heptose 1,7-bisphosphate phosphatase
VNRPAVFLDRDGVLNEVVLRDGRAASPRSTEELKLNPDAPEALARLRTKGFLLFAVTNQPDIARGYVPAGVIDEQNTLLANWLPIDATYTCPHDQAADCPCRKPRPGMLLDAASEWDIALSRSWLVGDRWVDLLAAEAAGVRPVLLSRPWSWEATSEGRPPHHLRDLPARDSLSACVDYIVDYPGD